MARILIIEDDLTMAELFCHYLEDEKGTIQCVETIEEAKEQLTSASYDIVLLDYQLPDGTGLDLLNYINEQGIPSAVIMITGHGSLTTAVKAMQLGARDFIVKPTSKTRLLCTLKNVLKTQNLQRVIQTHEKNISRKDFSNFVGASLPMQNVYRIIESAAPSKATVFITGESGTGKELCAEALHMNSPRQAQPLCAINCGAIPRDLMESEVFGHVKGAFTGAHTDREGLAHQANRGTLFLDEICEMDLDLQTKLLRFIQTGTFQKVGGDKEEQVDVRFVCATNRDPLKEVQEGRFREDLYYRLHVLPLALPPLRDRGEDILLIAQHFLDHYTQEEGKDFKKFEKHVRTQFLNYDWPGNVRQLQNVIWNIVALHQGECVTQEMLPAPLDALILKHAPTSISHSPSPIFGNTKETLVTLDTIEYKAIENALKVCNNNVSEAAHFLNVSTATLYRKKKFI